KAQVAAIATVIEITPGSIEETSLSSIERAPNEEIESLISRLNDLKTHYGEMELELKQAQSKAASQAETIQFLKADLKDALALNKSLEAKSSQS
ncbi:MAG: hypothetical protein ACKVQV_09375, partial [Bacteroidia bacterium]